MLIAFANLAGLFMRELILAGASSQFDALVGDPADSCSNS